MKLRRQAGEGAEVAAEAMNDIMFFLMFLFLIISTLANPNVIKLALPNAKQSNQMPKQPVVVSVAKGATDSEPLIFIGKEQVTKLQLETRLKAELRGEENPTVVLRVDRALAVQSLVDVLQVGEKMKCKMVLASAPGGG
jgi:biopolymer transport protein ExbD